MAKDKFYAVQNGRETGVYRSWAEAQAQVSGYSGAVFKKFDSASGAQSFASSSGGYSGSSGSGSGSGSYSSSSGGYSGHTTGYASTASYGSSGSWGSSGGYGGSTYTAPAPAKPVYKESSFNSRAEAPVSYSQSYTAPAQPVRAQKPVSKSYYAVGVGNQPGVYNSWSECQKATTGFSRPSFKKFDNLEDAGAFVDKYASSSSIPSSTSSYTSTSASTATAKPKSSSYYGVNYSNGKSEIFTTWKDCQAAVKHQRGVTFKKFDTLNDARSFTSNESAPELTRTQKQQSIKTYLDTRDEHSLKSQQKLPTKRVFMDGSFMNNKAGYGIYFGDNDPRNVAAPIHAKQVDSYVAEVHATRGALKRIHDEIQEFESGKRDVLEKYTLATDSETAIGLLSKYTMSWKESEFNTRKAGKELKEAVEYYKDIKQFYNKNSAIFDDHKFDIEWVKGHDGIEGNEAADQLAKQGALRL